MTREVITLGPDASAAEALGLCGENNVRHLPIVEGGQLVGLVSDRDLRDVSPPRDTAADEESTLSRVWMRDIMSTDLVTIHPLDTIEHAARELYERKIGCLPVVADDELVVGIVTSTDMMRTLIELAGASGVGSWVEVEVPNQPGALAGVTDIIRNRQINIASIFLAPAQRAPYRIHAASHRTAVLRLESSEPSGIVQNLEEIGYRAEAVKPYVPREPTIEESQERKEKVG